MGFVIGAFTRVSLRCDTLGVGVVVILERALSVVVVVDRPLLRVGVGDVLTTCSRYSFDVQLSGVVL